MNNQCVYYSSKLRVKLRECVWFRLRGKFAEEVMSLHSLIRIFAICGSGVAL